MVLKCLYKRDRRAYNPPCEQKRLTEDGFSFACHTTTGRQTGLYDPLLDYMVAMRHLAAVNRKLILWLTIPIFIVVLIVVCRTTVKYRYERARKVWKDDALEQIAKISMTNKEVLTEIDQIKHPTRNLDFHWAHEHVLLMTNGEFLVYAFRHGFNNGFVDHLFLAHGSNGRWYYSTYHFCSGMVGIGSDDPPGSIAEFSSRYSAREFDGRSEVCLQHTWPEK
jgi:hypothetical protein